LILSGNSPLQIWKIVGWHMSKDSDINTAPTTLTAMRDNKDYYDLRSGAAPATPEKEWLQVVCTVCKEPIWKSEAGEWHHYNTPPDHGPMPSIPESGTALVAAESKEIKK